MRKKKSPKKKGPKPASRDSPETASREVSRLLLEASKVPSKSAPNASDYNSIFASNSLFTAGELTPEALEELGLAYVDLPGVETVVINHELQQEPSKPSPQMATSRTVTSAAHDMFAPNPPRQTPNPPPTIPQIAPAQSSHSGRSYWNNNSPIFPILPGAVAREPQTPRDSPQNPASAFIREFIGPLSPRDALIAAIDSTPSSPQEIIRFISDVHEKMQQSGKLSPRDALLGAIQSTPSSPLDMFKAVSDIQREMQQTYRVDSPSSYKETTFHLDNGKVVSDIVRQVGGDSSSSPIQIPSAGGLFGAPSAEEIRNANDEAEEEAQRPETPVSVNNAEVYKRPTVADLRRERKQMHDELGEWVRSLRFARAELDGVVGGMEARMQVLKAVNRMQAPLRKAPLRRGR